MSEPIKILVTGSLGRMGTAVVECADEDPQVDVVHQMDVGDSLLAVLPDCDAVIDFSFHSFTDELVRGCVELNKHLVIGTTGHADSELASIKTAAAKIPIVFAPNFSVGINVLFWASRKTSEILGEGFDIEVVEMHHRMKKDAPSGTAKKLAEILAASRALSYERDARHGREGEVGARTAEEIGVHALRGGDVVGDHTVFFAGLGERLELTHRASSRHTFANGAIRAVKWLRDKKSGLYDMMDVLDLK